MNPQRLIAAGKLSTLLRYPFPRRPGSKYNPIHESFGGALITFVPQVLAYGVKVAVYGRRTEDDLAAERFLTDLGAESRLEPAAERGILNAEVEENGASTILRVSQGPQNWNPTTREYESLVHGPADAFAVGGSMDRDYLSTLLEIAAARGRNFYWNAGGNADLELAGMGQVFLQVSFAEFGDGQTSPVEFTRRLLDRTHAAAVVVTDAERGCVAVQAKDGRVLEVPAIHIPVENRVRTVGAGDAFFGGFVSLMTLASSQSDRFERALQVGRLTAAAHVSGVKIGGWRDLDLFERRTYTPEAAIRAA